MTDLLATASSVDAVLDAALKTLPSLKAKIHFLMQGDLSKHEKALTDACGVGMGTIRRWFDGKTAKLHKHAVPLVAAYFRVSEEALRIDGPLRKPTRPRTTPTRPHHGTLNYHLEALDIHEAHYVEVRPVESIQEAQSRIWGSLSRAPGAMADMKFETSAHTCVGPTFGAPVRYVIRVERVK